MNLSESISRYVVRRIHQHDHWYDQKSMLAAPLNLQKSDEANFYLLHGTLLQLLSAGHTVLTLPKDMQDVGLPTWQLLCFEPIFERLQRYFDDGFDFVALLNEFAQALADGADVQHWLSEQRTRFLMLLGAQQRSLSRTQMMAVIDEIVWLLRAYYTMRVLCADDVLAWAARLSSVFFANLHDVKSLDKSAPLQPICYWIGRSSVYFWLNRAYRAEAGLMYHIGRIRAAQVPPFTADNLDKLNEKQRDAVKLVANQAFALITGGPGTGKTYTVAQIVLALLKTDPDVLSSLALAAPTGKAAQRMSESLQKALGADVQMLLPEPKTIHRLLGIGATGVPRYHADHPLPYRMLIIDEASMLGAELACQLMAAVATGARVILLGDANQLAAVDAGAVLADLCRMSSLADLHCKLEQSQRFTDTSGVGKLAKLIKGDQQDKFSQLQQLIDTEQTLEFVSLDDNHTQERCYQYLSESYQSYFKKTQSLYGNLPKIDQSAHEEVAQLFKTLNEYRILCASHIGAYGDHAINAFLSKMHRKYLGGKPSNSPWYQGRVVMVVENRYDLELFNGDIGICLHTEQGLMVFFEGETIKMLSAELLSEAMVVTAYAITVHKSQGSEWETVAIVFDESSQRLLSKELIYTAVTRAKARVQLFSMQKAIATALITPTVRQTGLGIIETLQR
ncbi:exodeoxyribonuclease V subunit alpha [Moraxella sp. FZLJ2107]|uniref:exodeoxyribonuclease V subunit alpha n=1 Tax=unclassified Moraxella TaxID=2685852 RepID=UPI0020C842D5|nr:MULTISPECIES: exodeoxyribonuclease V subunit alpha [unclassified Moraxella]UTO05296.1 exodeoxyribonuclease V subunit alpha [Moraxella sp. FZLJ2107]UTO22031.1 exodeoxyribonuclease V subunit alpha [Moraxella sp. FZLJ2109]